MRAKQRCEKCARAWKVPGQGQHYCADCKESAQWVAERKRATRSIVKRAPCEICGGLKEPGHGRKRCEKCIAASRKTRKCMSCPARIYAPARKCELCRAVAREKRRQFDIARHRAYRQVKQAKPKDKRRKDREGARMRHRLREERNGRIIPPVAALPPVRKGSRAVHVPAAPLVPFLRQATAIDLEPEELAERAHMRAHSLRAVIDGSIDTLRDFQADRLCVALGLSMSNVYDLAQMG